MPIMQLLQPLQLHRKKKLGHIELKFVLLLIQCVPLFFLPPAYAQVQNVEVLKSIYERAVDAYSKQQYDKSMELYQQLLKVAPAFAPAYNGMALVNEANGGDEDKSIEYLKTAIGYDPKLTQAYENLGRIYFARQDMNQADIYFEKAIKLDPNLPNTQLSLAWINLMVKSKPITALRYFKMVEKVSHDPKIYYGMGSAYFASNQRTEAMEMITKLHDLGADDLAEHLEDSMRQNAQVNADASSVDANASPTPAPILSPLATTENKPTGMKARLRGKLSDY